MRGTGTRRGGHFLVTNALAPGGEAVAVVEDVVTHLGQLAHAVGLQRPTPLVGRPDRGLRGEPARVLGMGGERARVLDDGGVEARPVAGQRRVRQPDLHGLRGAHRQAVLGDPPRARRADPAGQRVGPVLRTEQPHRPVVRVEHDALPHQHLIGPQRQHHPAGARVTPYCGHHDLARAGDDLAADVVDRVDVPPGLGRGVRARLDDAQVDPVAEGRAALQQEDARVLCRCRTQRGGEPVTLARRGRTVVEVEGQDADVTSAPVRDLPGLRRVGHRIQCLGHVRDAVAQHGRRRQLHPRAGSAGDRAGLPDPDRAVAGPDEHCSVPAQQDRSRLRGTMAVQHGGVRVRIEDRHLHPGEFRADTRRAVACLDVADDLGRRVGPGEATIGLGHARPQTPGSAGGVHRIGREPGAGSLLDHLVDQFDGGVRDRSGVQNALARELSGEREAAARPDRTGVHLVDRRQRSHTPLRRGFGDRPVQ